MIMWFPHQIGCGNHMIMGPGRRAAVPRRRAAGPAAPPGRRGRAAGARARSRETTRANRGQTAIRQDNSKK